MNGWKWTDEELPEENKSVLCLVRQLCTYDNGEGGYVFDVPDCFITQGCCVIQKGFKRKRVWFLNISPDVAYGCDTVVAWRELPKPPHGWKRGKHIPVVALR